MTINMTNNLSSFDHGSAEFNDESSVSSLMHLGQWLSSQHYRFATVTPATHALVNRRAGNEIAKSIADVFGWSRPFKSGLLSAKMFGDLRDAGLIVPLHRTSAAAGVGAGAALFKSAVRCSSLGNRLFFHSAFPTNSADSVFFGPDTYRFASLIEREIQRRPWPTGIRILDVGCGAGPGGILATEMVEGFDPLLVLSDINHKALRFAQANARLAGLENVQCLRSDLFNDLQGDFDLIVANPPYLIDPASRVYRDGGGVMGTGLGVRIVREGLGRLQPGGALVLYTGVPIIDGRDQFREEVESIANAKAMRLTYEEIDPDVFGEELASPAYALVDRIAIVSAVFTL